MIDKLNFVFKSHYNFIKFVEYYCSKKLIKIKYGNGSRYFREFGLYTEYFQIFYDYVDKGNLDDNIINCYVSLGSEYSNRFGFFILKYLYKYFKVFDLKIKRFDVCLDIKGVDGKNFIIKSLKLKKKPVFAKPKLHQFHNAENDKFLDTVYLMSKNFVIRIYDKGVEQGLYNCNSDWKRFEVQINYQMIESYNFDVIDFEKEDIFKIRKRYFGLLKKILDNYDFNIKYKKLLKKLISGNYENVKSKIKYSDLEKTLDFITNQYGAYLDYYFIKNIDKYKRLLNDDELQNKVVLDILSRYGNRS